jgi:hypothetical protein
MKKPHPANKEPGNTAKDEMQEQDTLQLLALKLKLPRQKARDNDRHGTDSGRQKVVIGDDGQAAAPGALREEVKQHANGKQGDGEMDQCNVLGVLGEENCFGVEWIHISFF